MKALRCPITAIFYLRGSDSGSVHVPPTLTRNDNSAMGYYFLPFFLLSILWVFLDTFLFPVFSGSSSPITQSLESPGIHISYLRNLKNF